jgi:hypothetical protein
MIEGIHERERDNMFDLTPQGRDDWYAKLAYPDGPHWSPR